MIDERLAVDTAFNAYDRRFITWAPREAASRGPCRPFDLPRLLSEYASFRRVASWQREGAYERLPSAMTPEEARFWLVARTSYATLVRTRYPQRQTPETRDELRSAADDEMRAFDYAKAFDFAWLAERLHDRMPDETLALPLGILFDAPTLMGFGLAIADRLRSSPYAAWLRRSLHTYYRGLANYVVPYSSESAFREIGRQCDAHFADAVGPHLAATWTGPAEYESLAPFVAALHLERPVEQCFAVGATHLRAAHWSSPKHELVLASPTRALAGTRAREVRLRFYTSRAIREWLATTDESGTTFAASAIVVSSGEAAGMVAALGMVASVGGAAAILALARQKDGAAAAVGWFEANPSLARPVLARAAVARTREGDFALDLLRGDVAAGRGDAVRAVVSPGVRALLFGVPRTHEWLDDVRHDGATLPEWLYADALPILTLSDGATIDERRTPAIVEALRASAMSALDPRIAWLREHVARGELDLYARTLLRQWLRADGASRDRFVLIAVGLLGGDECVRELVPSLRRWPLEANHRRARVGIDALRAIGSDLALGQIGRIASTVPFAALKRYAEEAFVALAEARGLSRERLEDRLVPTHDFLAEGTLPLTVGEREYTVIVGDDLVPVLRDERGKTVKTVPKVAGEAPVWAPLKKRVRTTLAGECDRLERAMSTGRSWFADEFIAVVAGHPLLRRIGAGLVWIADAPSGRPTTFAMAANELRTSDSRATTIDSLATVRVAHPLDLSGADLVAWQAYFAARRQPFEQLERVTYRLGPGEDATTVTRFDARPLFEKALASRLRACGWSRGDVLDGGMCSDHAKRFDRARVVAVVTHDPIAMGYTDPNSTCAFRGCRFYAIDDVGRQSPVALRDVAPIAFSEVARDLTVVLR